MSFWMAALAIAAPAAALEESGRTHLYNMELAEARIDFAELGRLSPSSPAGPYYEATALWMEEFTRRGGMAGATFRTGQYWSDREKRPPDPELERDFKKLVDESIARAEALLLREPDDPEGLFYRGSAEGLMSAYLASVEHSYFGAYQAGKRAKEYHERLLDVAPENADACLLPGIFEYTVATLPRSLRILGFLVGMRGSKKKGLELVERAVEKGNKTRWVARLSMSVLLQREKRYRGSLSLLQELEEAFPRNPFLTMERGNVHLLRKNWDRAQLAFEEVVRKRAEGHPGFALLPPSLVFLRLGESHLFAKRYVEAGRELERALSTPAIPDPIRAQIFLRRGMASDARGLRAAARWDYRRALRLADDSWTGRLAERYLDDPFP